MELFVRARIVFTVGLVGVAALGLSGCAPEHAPTSSASPSASASSASAAPSASATPSTTPSGSTPSATPTPSVAPGVALHIACDTLVSAQAFYDFNPNFGLAPNFTPPAGTPAAVAVSDGGTACSWLNQTSNDRITISVATPNSSSLAGLRKTAAQGTPVSGYGDAAYFSTSGGVGRIDVFRGTHWLTASSDYFESAADASQLLTASLKALP